MQIGLGLSLTIPRVGGFSPASLFANSEPGAWYDPSDLTTLFQDRAGTTPVTATGQSVGRVLDKSGRGFHMTAVSDAARGTYNVDENGKAFILFDGADDSYVTSTITPGTDKMQVFSGVRRLITHTGMIVEYSPVADTNNGSFHLAVVSNSRQFMARGTATVTISSAGSLAPQTEIYSGLADISGDNSVLRVNGTQVAQSSGDQGTGNYLNYSLNIGRRNSASIPFNGRLYQMVVRFGPNLDADTIGQVERFVADRTGVTI